MKTTMELPIEIWTRIGEYLTFARKIALSSCCRYLRQILDFVEEVPRYKEKASLIFPRLKRITLRKEKRIPPSCRELKVCFNCRLSLDQLHSRFISLEFPSYQNSFLVEDLMKQTGLTRLVYYTFPSYDVSCLTSLRSLTLGAYYMYGDSLTNLVNLTHLDLSATNIRVDLDKFPLLRSLVCNSVVEDPPTTLRSLSLHKNQLIKVIPSGLYEFHSGYTGSPDLESLSRATGLRKLELPSVGLPGEILSTFTGLVCFRSPGSYVSPSALLPLTRLNTLKDMPLTDSHISVLSRIRLKRLELSLTPGEKISDEAISSLAWLTYLSCGAQADLTDRALVNLGRLKFFDCCSARGFTDEGVRNCPNLRIIYRRESRISDDCSSFLKKLKTLY